MTEPAVVKMLLPEHRDRVWRGFGLRVWSWNEGRQQWLDESLGEANQRAWDDNPSSIDGFTEYVPAPTD